MCHSYLNAGLWGGGQFKIKELLKIFGGQLVISQYELDNR